MPRRPLALLALTCALLAGCGYERTEPPDLARPATATELRPRAVSGVEFRAPVDGWRLQEGNKPLVATMSSGAATLAIWRYPRSEPLPSGEQALAAARRRLVRAARERDATLDVIRATTLRVGGAPAIQLRARARVGKVRRTVRSTHIFAEGAEVVVDAFAPAEAFRPVDREVFRPLVRSVRVRPAPAA